MHGTMVKLLLPRIFIRYGPAQYSALQGMFAPGYHAVDYV